MGKKRKRKKQKIEDTPSIPVKNENQQSKEDLQITFRVLNQLSEDHSLLLSKDAKEIRGKIFEIVNILKEVQSSTSHLISEALEKEQWIDASNLLLQMIEKKNQPKLGSVQRWVRDIFASSTINETEAANILSTLLISINQKPFGDDSSLVGPFQMYPSWKLEENLVNETPQKEIEKQQEIISNMDLETYIVTTETGWKEGLIVWGCKSNFKFEFNDEKLIEKINIPFIYGGFFLNNVLSKLDCEKLIYISSKMGFIKEASYSFTGKIFPSAEGCVWFVDSNLNDSLYNRVFDQLPKKIGSKEIVGINQRWRIYKYNQNSVYRPHIDGAWNQSGLKDGEYFQDISNGTVSSRFTLIIYLNDNFENGGTTFYLPSSVKGNITGRSVTPKTGCMLLFPHGEGLKQVAIVHEGSAVTKGTKYIIRTEVLYTQN